MTTIQTALALTLALLVIFYVALSIPEVHIAHLTGECVKVVPPSAGDCNNIPATYSTIIVAPR